MKRELPVNLDVPIKTYSYYAYSHCIISAKERIGCVAAKFSIFDYDQEQWKTNKACFECDESKDGRFQLVSDNPFSQNLNGAIYRLIKQEDRIHIKIEYQQYSHPWGDIHLFITDIEEERIGHQVDKYLCRLGNFCRDGLYFYADNELKNFKLKQEDMFDSSFELILYRKGNQIEAYGGKTGGHINHLHTQSINFPVNKELKIGIQVMLNDNVYYNWLFSNHIQISCDVSDYDRKIEFFYGVLKDWKCTTVNYFLNYNNIDVDYVIKWGIIKFIKKCIHEGKYIELMLNQYHIESREEYRMEHHYHQNLIYGYDDSKKEILLIGYKRNGLLEKTKITYSGIKSTILKKGILSSVLLIEYKQDGYAYRWHTDYIKEMIQQYLEGFNSSFYLNHLVTIDSRIYGIKVYDELLTEQGMEVLCRDKRIAHLLYEHKVCMKARIEFLQFREIITKKQSESLLLKMDWIMRTTYNMRNLTIKYNMTGAKIAFESIKNKLNEIKIKEVECLKEMLNYLESG